MALPKGWDIAKIDDICNLNMGQSPPSSSYNDNSQGLPFFQGKTDFQELYPKIRKWCSNPQKVAQKDDVLMSVRAPVGPVNLAPTECCIGRGLAALSPKGTIKTRYILYMLRFLESDIAKLGTGTTFNAISKKIIQDYKIPVAPINEQMRIIDKIENIFSNLDAGVLLLKKAKDKLKNYRASILKAAVDGKLTEQWREMNPPSESASQFLERILLERRRKWEEDQLAKYAEKGQAPPKNWREKYKEPVQPDTSSLPPLPEGWCWATVSQIGAPSEQPVLTGPFGSTLGQNDFIQSGVPLLTIGCLKESGLTINKAFYITEDKAKQLDRYRVKTGDILFSRQASVGRASYVTEKYTGAVINYHLMRLRLDEACINPLYLVYYIQGARVVKEYLRNVNHGATRDGINTNQLLSMPVAVPPVLEQKEINNLVNKHLYLYLKLIQITEIQIKRAYYLRQAILKKAFEGKLVPQDPNDEPASVLLARIREEGKATKDNTTKTKRKKAGKKNV